LLIYPRSSVANSPTFKTHVSAHEAVLANESWFGDGIPVIGKQFTAEKAKERKADIIDLLFRTAKRERRAGDAGVADQLEILADKIFYCHSGRHCGSLACEDCRLAFQKAKFSGQTAFLAKLAAEHSEKQVVMANIIPLRFTYRPDQLDQLDVAAANRWVKDVLTRAGFRRIMLGSFDLSWEDGFYQGHWHIPMLTSNREELKRRLKAIFPVNKIVRRPVVVSVTFSNGYLPYKDKAIKIVNLLKRNRRGLPSLLLALDRTDPLELMVLFRLRLSAQHGELQFTEIERR
jgi:hypothetical protein